MARPRPFAELYKKHLKAGTGRIAWLTKNNGDLKSRDLKNHSWDPKEICGELNVAARTEQFWRNGSSEPKNLESLLNLLFVESDDPLRAELQDATYAQLDIRQAEKIAAKATRWNIKKLGSPYLGLSTFTYDNRHIFFGRDRHIRILTEKVLSNPFVAVIGASGAGKSSLVWAGLIPNLVRRPECDGQKCAWKWVRFTPGKGAQDPMRRLAEALVHGPDALLDIHSWDVEQELARGRQAVGDLVARIIGPQKENTRFLVFIDQFEELFDQSMPSERQRAFLDVISDLISIDTARVVVTIRNDFIPRCMKSPNFPDISEWFSTSHWVASPNEDDILEMISGPERVSDVKFEPGLIDQIVKDTGKRTGNLPLMAFALERLFKESSRIGQMTWSAYLDFGGVHGAIGNAAEMIYAPILANYGEQANTALFGLFRLLVEVDEDSGAPVRRVCALKNVPCNPIINELIEKFTKARLLVINAAYDNIQDVHQGEDERTVEVAHEALFWSWELLSDWVTQHRSFYLAKRQLVREAKEWEAHGKPEYRRWKDERVIEVGAALKALGIEPDHLQKEFLGPLDTVECEKLINPRSKLSHAERLAIGVRLEILGDSRPGVGIRPDGVPDISWCLIPPGEASIEGVTQRLMVNSFYISKFTITVLQWGAFIFSSDGYSSDTWWLDLPRGYETPGQQSRGGGHPAVNVLWSEAVAFCRWYSARTGETIRLPTECEWQWAASGGNSTALYPWGDEWNSAYVNNEDSQIGTTIAVGLYPEGRSPFGPEDMLGNVWEWCLNDRDRVCDLSPNQFGDKAPRGGSYGTTKSQCNVYMRGGYYFGYRNSNTGFRVVRPIDASKCEREELA